jgi:hypothetical protein
VHPAIKAVGSNITTMKPISFFIFTPPKFQERFVGDELKQGTCPIRAENLALKMPAGMEEIFTGCVKKG